MRYPKQIGIEESEVKYSVVKKTNRKHKRLIFLIWMASFLTLASLAVHILFPYISTNLFLNVFPSLPSTAKSQSTFYGENIDMSQILPTSQHYIVNNKGQDLIDIADDLGINLIRITNIQRSFANDADSLYTQEQWNQVLRKMQSKGIRALILIETASDNANYYTHQIQPIYLQLVQKYIESGVFANPDVYAVDLKNEPVLTDANLNMIKTAHTMIKAKYPDLKQTIGAWATPLSSSDPYNPSQYNWVDYSAGQKLDNIVDFYSLHMYGLAGSYSGGTLDPDLRTKLFISQAEHSLQTQKPILIEEFGEANGDAVSDQDTIGNPELQADVYQGVYQALKEMKNNQIIGSVAFDFYNRDQYPNDAWAIVKNNGNYLFPAAYILQEYALGKSNPSLQATTVVTSHSYLVTNADNSTTKNLHISDRIGIKLQLDSSQNYSVSLSAPGLQPVDSFYYNSYIGSYYTVYQAVSKGSIQLNILPNSTCSTNSNCTAPIYTLTINIQ